MNKAIFLDRDGTINVEKHYLYRIEDFEFMPGSIDALKKLQEAGFMLIIITNQSGIARGYYSEEDFNKLNSWMLNYLESKGVKITAVYYCPHLPEAKIMRYRKSCQCRKPLLGMFEKAVSDYNIDLSQSFAIGDKMRDCAICEETTCRGFLIGNQEKQSLIEEVKRGGRKNIRYEKNLEDCTCSILNM